MSVDIKYRALGSVRGEDTCVGHDQQLAETESYEAEQMSRCLNILQECIAWKFGA